MISENALQWLATGARGTSVNTIFTFATGVDALGHWLPDHPHDIFDFRRCRLLLEQCPELRSCLPRVAAVSPEWAEIVNFWDDICVLQDLEDPTWREQPGKAIEASKMLKNILNRISDK